MRLSVTVPVSVPVSVGGGVEVLGRRRVLRVVGRREEPHAPGGEHVPDELLEGALLSVLREVGQEDRVSHVQERRVGRRELHRPRDQLTRERPADRTAQVPERLPPDLPVCVHLGKAGDPAHVAVGVAARAGRARTTAFGHRGLVDRAVDRFGAVTLERGDDVAVRERVELEAVLDHEVHPVPVAPALPHGGGLEGVEGARTRSSR